MRGTDNRSPTTDNAPQAHVNYAAMKKTLALIALLATSVFAADTPDLIMQNRIRQEGFRNSKVMDTAEELMDFVGPRLTGSPNMKRANEWTRDSSPPSVSATRI
jgi:hypothetical protein